MCAKQWPTGTRGASVIAALVLGVYALDGCTTYRVKAPATSSTADLVGRSVQFAFGADSLTLNVTRIENTWVFGRVAEGSGPAAILLGDVRAARTEELSADGHAQELHMAKVRRDPTVLEGANVWFETKHGNVVLRGIRVLPDGWIDGHVVSNDPTGTSIASSTRVKVRSNALVRLDLGRTQGYAIRTVDTGKTVVDTAARTLLILFGFLVVVALIVGTDLEMTR
ncbi:MAG: hypothetical protein IPP90_15420 [Gemmatimonadaceae bacterium]|nr:hypothetical protein [Gemmatimonadaceae bacterium]